MKAGPLLPIEPEILGTHHSGACYPDDLVPQGSLWPHGCPKGKFPTGLRAGACWPRAPQGLPAPHTQLSWGLEVFLPLRGLFEWHGAISVAGQAHAHGSWGL